MDEDGCSKTSVGAVAALPDDLLVEIFSRVPAKSVCRFKCVSKTWRDLIANPEHRKKLHQAMQGLFIMTPAENHFSFGFVDLTEGSVPLDEEPGFSFLTERRGMHNLVLLDCCNGLILFRRQEEPPHYAELGDIVCNPTTKQCKYVPTCGPPDRFKHTFLAFDPAISSQFHLVQFQISQEDWRLEALHAYSSEIGTWSHNQIDSQEGLLAGWHRHVTLYYSDPRCAFVNGLLYLIVCLFDQEWIVAVDVQGKAKRMISVPGVGDEGHMSCNLEQSQGCLHFMTKKIFDATEMIFKLSIWVLQDYDTQEWMLKNTMSSLELYGELIGHFLDFHIVDIHQDRNVVFLMHYDSGKLIAYDMEHKEVTTIATFEERRTPFGFARYVPCFSQSLAFTN